MWTILKGFKNFHPLILNISKINAATPTKILQHIYSIIPDSINIRNLKSFNRIGQEQARAPRVLSTVYIMMNSFMYTVFWWNISLTISNWILKIWTRSVALFSLPRLNIANRRRVLGQINAEISKSDVAVQFYALITAIYNLRRRALFTGS